MEREREELKRAAGHYAADFVTDGMIIGLGSGSTARYATLRIAERLREGSLANIVAVPTSNETARLAQSEGIPLTRLNALVEGKGERSAKDGKLIDLTIDGADEVDPCLHLIKGLGGFLLREKIVASVTRREIIVVDESKLVETLGTHSPVPVEVVRFGWRVTCAALERTGACVRLRMRNGQPYVTDERHFIIDCRYEAIPSPYELARALEAIPGVVGHGLFLGMTHAVVIASSDRVWVKEK
ncbi:MAG: ribose-5-phosphate isomerase RpiA [Chloroflexi bacterium]|nr:ribose-5-phosphate isomerase RpiA [Chloroflexota bacterium]